MRTAAFHNADPLCVKKKKTFRTFREVSGAEELRVYPLRTRFLFCGVCYKRTLKIIKLRDRFNVAVKCRSSTASSAPTSSTSLINSRTRSLELR